MITKALLLTSTLLHAAQAQEEEYGKPKEAIVFPWFVQILGVIVFFILTRTKWIGMLPFTAVMFLLGMAMGIGAARLDNSERLTTSILQWSSIDSNLIFLVFLPGLLFKDSFGLNVRLFIVSFWQVINLAFPMVLAGTALTALVAYYIFPYGWSWNLAMTFGAILSATDPVAVFVMLNDVGAPPRLKMHIGGESMLNDGSSYVFYSIFSLLFLSELGVEGLGSEVDLGQGVAMFFQMSLGGMAFGIAFGLGLTLLLYMLNRKLRGEENVTQTVATITIAYLTYYVADVGQTSGIIATLFCGVTARAFGNSMINDHELMGSFWELVESLLNTLLFTLAGVVWGTIVFNEYDHFHAKDWGYLIMLYVLLNAIRFFLVACWYPLISRIGLKTDWQEAVFLSFSGLRGAVAITLGVSLYSQVLEVSDQTDPKFETQASQVFYMIGGVTLIALFINGTTAGPLLKTLGLAKSTDARVKLLKHMEHIFRRHYLDDFVTLLADDRFKDVDLWLVREHVPLLKDLTLQELKSAVLRNKDLSPKLTLVLPYLDFGDAELSSAVRELSERTIGQSKLLRDVNKVTTKNTIELRHFYLNILTTVYNEQLDRGEMDGRQLYVAYALIQSLDIASSDVDRGAPLNDWDAANIATALHLKIYAQMMRAEKCANSKRYQGDAIGHTSKYQQLRIDVLRALSFIKAHEEALEKFKAQFEDPYNGSFRGSEQSVVDEVVAEIASAQEVLKRCDKHDLNIITSHYFCTILLNQMAAYIEKLLDGGILIDREATAYLEVVETSLEYAKHCSGECRRGRDHTEVTTAKVEEPAGEQSRKSLRTRTLMEENGKRSTKEDLLEPVHA